MYATYESPTTAYFSTLTRTWELGVGAGLAVFMSRGSLRAPRWVVEAAGALGLAAVLLACVWYTPETRFPGYQALLPVLGTAALLYAGGATHQGATSRLMSVTPGAGGRRLVVLAVPLALAGPADRRGPLPRGPAAAGQAAAVPGA